MKIDLSLAPLDKDGSSRAPNGADADRGAMGAAFGRAVRDAEGKRSANSNDKAAKADADPKSGADVDAKDETSCPAPEGDTDADVQTEAAPLQSILGALAALTSQKAAVQDARRNAAEAAEPHAAVASGDPALDGAEALEASAVKDKGAMKLDVLRMETHFEPRQDGMVLVEGSAKAKKDALVADTKAKAVAAGVERSAVALAEQSKARAADARAAAVEEVSATSKTDGAPPMRFDEALARLGRAGNERSGGDTGRDGSAAAQSALAELAARRSAAKGAEAVSTAGSIDAGPSSTSGYNLAGQVAGPIMEALGDPSKAPADAAPRSTDAHLRMRAGGGALKTLTIQLHPEHLGTVDVSMRLNEGRLTLELAASRSDTALMLLDDQASLRKLLEHAGFSLDDAAISVITRDSGQVRTAEGGATGSQQRDTGGSPAGEGRSETRDQSGGSDDRPERRQTPDRRNDEAMPAKPRSGSTYL